MINNDFITALWVGFLIGALPWTILVTFTNMHREYIGHNEKELENSTVSAVAIGIPLGRLGNLLFQYATLIGVATKLKMVPLLPPDTELRRVFKAISALKVVDYPPFNDNRRVYYETHAGIFEPEILKMQRSDFLIDGYFQSWKYFGHIQKRIRDEFKFNNAIQEKADLFLKDVISNASTYTLIGVHIRRNDYSNDAIVKEVGFRSAPAHYVTKAMNYYRNLYKDAKFVVCSDDKKWITKFFHGEKDVKLSYHERPEVDLAILSSCNHTVQTVGSFGWWGAFLSGGHSVYYKNWIKPGSRADKWYINDDYNLPTWMGMSEIK